MSNFGPSTVDTQSNDRMKQVQNKDMPVNMNNAEIVNCQVSTPNQTV